MVAEIIEIVDVQTFQGQQMLNVFHYVDPAGTGTAMQLLSDYVAHVIPLEQPMQNVGLQHTNLRWRQVYPTASLTLDYATGLPISGTDASDPLASADAWSFKFILGNPTQILSGGFTGHIMRGGCRIGGANEGSASGNTCGAGLVAAAVAWAAELRNPGEGAFELCVASFLIGNHIRGGPPRARSHTVTSYAVVSDVSAPAPSTQNTRKVLRGHVS